MRCQFFEFLLSSSSIDVVVAGATVQRFCTWPLTMIFLNILLLVGLIGFFYWLVLTFAVCALPLFVG